MCDFCEREKNMDIGFSACVMKIVKEKNSPTGYQLISDNSGGEYAECFSNIKFCPMCGKSLEVENEH